MPALTSTQIPADAHAEIQALLRRHGLSGAAAAVAHFSFSSPRSFIGAHDPDGRITPLIGFLPLPVRGTDLLAAISTIDENAPRLVANYRNAFPEIAGRLSEFGTGAEPGADESLRWLLSACSLTLWLEDADVARALVPSPGGVKVDTVVIEQDGCFLFDGRRLLRSLMSYRIADVPKYILACSVFESLGDFAADAIRRLLRDWKAEAVVCTGDLFARNRILRQQARKRTLGLRVPVHFPAAED
ncbi:MAG TPA: hypothetical protein VIV12_22790 [Streptosporangiaceae bacterium]